MLLLLLFLSRLCFGVGGFFTSLEHSAELPRECSYMKSWFAGMHLGDDLQSVLKMQNGIEEFLLWK